MNVQEEMSLIFNKLSKESQCYLLSLANMAKIAEDSAFKKNNSDKHVLAISNTLQKETSSSNKRSRKKDNK